MFNQTLKPCVLKLPFLVCELYPPELVTASISRSYHVQKILTQRQKQRLLVALTGIFTAASIFFEIHAKSI